MVPAAGVISFSILVFGHKLRDSLEMVYENISYYELNYLWKGPIVRLSLMVAAFVISWAIMFYIPKKRTCLSEIGQNTMPIYMLHRILRDVIMFAGAYDYLSNWGFVSLFVLIWLTVVIVNLLVSPPVIKAVNRVLKLKLVKQGS